MRAFAATVGLLGVAALAAGPAHAGDNDPALQRLCRGYNPTQTPAAPCGTAVGPDQAAFKNLAREYAFALAPKLLSPAETLGVNGFQFGLIYGASTISSDESYWQRGVEDESPSGMLHTLSLDMRKGLPFSFEVGGQATYLLDSELWAFGGSLKWALNEAVEQFPVDLAVRGGVSHLVGSTQLSLTMVSIDAVLSRSFGVGGVVNIGPYLAYSPVLTFARSDVIDATPGTSTAVDPNDITNSFAFAGEDDVIHRFVIGVRFIFGALVFTPEAVLTEGLQQYNAQLGIDF